MPSSVALSSTARTASGTSGALPVTPMAGTLAVALNVTTVTGTTPTLDVRIEWSQDGGVTFMGAQPADTFTQVTAAAVAVKTFSVKGETYRIGYTIAGTTPSFTFGVTAQGISA